MFSWRTLWVDAKLGAGARSTADSGISGRRELGGQIMRTETSDGNYNISTAAQPSSKNEGNDEAGLKRVWWARTRREREKDQENGGVAAT